MVRPAIIVVYIYPGFGGKWDNYAKRFARCYRNSRPTIDHHLIVVSNGVNPTKPMKEVFKGVDCEWFIHNNAGYDIGAYQNVSTKFKDELMVFFGASSYFRRAGWLERMVQSYDQHGSALYGAMGHRGDLGHRVWPHLRTTGFWVPATLMNEYPIRIISTSQRYEFEHGKTSFSEWIKFNGLKRWVVTFDGEYLWEDWNRIKNGYHRGDQSNCLCGDRLTEPPYYPIP